jgi:acyl carrier protein
MEEIEAKLREFIVSEFKLDADSVYRDTLLFSSGLLDSFSMVDLLAFVEGLAGRRVRVVDVNLDNLDTIDRIVALIARTPAA